MNRSLLLVLCALPALAPNKQEPVQVGLGTYTTVLPAGAKRPQDSIYRTSAMKGPMPTNDWWSSLSWMPLSDTMFPHPLAVRAVEGGLRVFYPGARLTANEQGIFGMNPAGNGDLVIGHSGVSKFSEARADAASDWFVSAMFENGSKKLRTSFGHGSPFVFVNIEDGNPTLAFREKPQIWSGDAGAATLGVSVGDRHYGVFAPTGSSWTGLEGTKWIAQTKGKGYFSVAVLPDRSVKTLELFHRYAHAHVTDTRVSWNYNEKSSVVSTTFTFATKNFEKSESGTLFALYPHQWSNSKASLTGHSYGSVRGEMKLGKGASFTTEMKFHGVLPSLPLTSGTDKAKLAGFIDDEVKNESRSKGDTYWLGKEIGKLATMIPISEQVGNKSAADLFAKRIRTAMENFFTAKKSDGSAKSASEGVFYYDKNWGTLIGYPASFGSDIDLNDHHFHYGYFIRAAGELARRDPSWAADSKWGGMVKLLIRDIASADRNDPQFPFLRAMDPYAGHSWASGHAKFGDGNNNESSSEAMNAWYGMILFGEATGDKELRDLGVWLFTTELEAVNSYWFDVADKFHPPSYTPSVVTMVWGGKGANATWFSGNPEMVHGINFLPITGASTYLGLYPEYCAKNYAALVAENKADDAKKPPKTKNATANVDGTTWDAWADLVWMYRALSDPKDALAQFNSRPKDFKPEEGNSIALTYAWISTLHDVGQVDRTIAADTASYAVFKKSGKRTYVAYNFGKTPRVVTFSDGTKVKCPANAFGIKKAE